MNVHPRLTTTHRPQARRRQLLLAALAGMGLLALPTGALAQASFLEPWLAGKKAAQGYIKLSLPLVAEDGSAVPLSIEIPAWDSDSHVESLAIFAPRNPTPEVASFTFGPEIGNIKLATRIRLSESQTVIVVARSSDGQVFMQEREVRVTTSGCIAPAQADASSEMQARVRIPKKWQAGQAGEITTMISHPMSTGLAQDAQGHTPAKRIIERFEVVLDQRPVIEAQYFRSLSLNPYLKFEITPRSGGTLALRWTEDTGRHAEHTETLILG